MSPAMDRLGAALSERHVVQREIGAVGMALVYLAEDLEHRRQVAIKVLRPERSAWGSIWWPGHGSRRHGPSRTRSSPSHGRRTTVDRSTTACTTSRIARSARLGMDIQIACWDALHERYMTPARTALGLEAAESAARVGREMTFEAAVAEARSLAV